MLNHALKIIIISIMLDLISGCAPIELGASSLPIGLSLFHSPVSFKTEIGKNGPLSITDKCSLEEHSEKINSFEKNISKEQYSHELNNTANLCADKLNDKSNYTFKYDNLNDFYFPDKNTLVFVAISGGGARAASLAEAVFTLLERKYNSLSSRAGLHSNQSSLLDNIDAFSTVSGGSLFSYQVARIKYLMNLKEKEINNISNAANSNYISLDNIDKSYFILNQCDNLNNVTVEEQEEKYNEFKVLKENFNKSKSENSVEKLNSLLHNFSFFSTLFFTFLILLQFSTKV